MSKTNAKFRISDLVTDRDLEEGGVELQYEGSFYVKVRRISCSAYQEYIINSGGIPEDDKDARKEFLKEAAANTLLVSWRGLYDVDEEGNDTDVEIPYSKELALDLIKKSNDFYNDILIMATNRENFKNAQKRKAEKN